MALAKSCYQRETDFLVWGLMNQRGLYIEKVFWSHLALFQKLYCFLKENFPYPYWIPTKSLFSKTFRFFFFLKSSYY